jgi:hypothetical protein
MGSPARRLLSASAVPLTAGARFLIVCSNFHSGAVPLPGYASDCMRTNATQENGKLLFTPVASGDIRRQSLDGAELEICATGRSYENQSSFCLAELETTGLIRRHPRRPGTRDRDVDGAGPSRSHRNYAQSINNALTLAKLLWPSATPRRHARRNLVQTSFAGLVQRLGPPGAKLSAADGTSATGRSGPEFAARSVLAGRGKDEIDLFSGVAVTSAL